MIVALVGDKPGMMVVGGDCRIAVVDFAGAPLYVGYDRRLGIPKHCGLIFLLVAQSVARTHAHRHERARRAVCSPGVEIEVVALVGCFLTCSRAEGNTAAADVSCPMPGDPRFAAAPSG